MNHNQLDIKDIFLSAERDFSADAISVRKKRVSVRRLDMILPLLFGVIALIVIFKFNKDAFSEVTFNSLNDFYTIYTNEITALMQRVSF